MKIFVNNKYYRLVKDKRFIIQNNKIYKLSNIPEENDENKTIDELNYCVSIRLFKYSDSMLQCDSCGKVRYINKRNLRKRQTRYTHRRRNAGKRMHGVVDKLDSR